ncbi:MAG: aminotransferase class V-fold PLP-dependent enzyme [Flavobacteriaceae bacterium]|nr:aminotransferase class V-fold PLP-dependent enzyme [Flavobacteriaceae bacterium]
MKNKISFKNDYSEGCHPQILDALIKYNLSQQDGYGEDQYSLKAKELILNKLNSKTSKVYFVSGGTQANMLVISSALRPHESVISAQTGHIFANETGAIESTGHKVNSVNTPNGKLSPSHIQKVIDEHPLQPHQLKQKMVFISNSTEIGTIYSKKELEDLSAFCKSNDLYLYLDGARLAQGLTSENSDITLEDISKLTDVFYIGGTKNGALIGEAIVINNPELQKYFEYYIKQKGAMLAKGRLLGIQFLELFKGNLYFDLAKHANQQAMLIKKAFTNIGCLYMSETFTNQIFPILNNLQIDSLSKDFDFYVWKKIDENNSAIRVITSWATKDKDVDIFINAIKKLS